MCFLSLEEASIALNFFCTFFSLKITFSSWYILLFFFFYMIFLSNSLAVLSKCPFYLVLLFHTWRGVFHMHIRNQILQCPFSPWDSVGPASGSLGLHLFRTNKGLTLAVFVFFKNMVHFYYNFFLLSLFSLASFLLWFISLPSFYS